MVDVVDRPEGWNKELYDKLSFEYLIECATKIDGIKEWNLAYEGYLKSEWERLFPHDKEYDPEDKAELFDLYPGFIQPDFSGKDFNNVILENANFYRVQLDGADFSEADFGKVDFYRAQLDGADFSEAHFGKVDFSNALLNGANFWHTDFDDADFSNAKLVGANFTHANIEGADFTDAHLQDSVFLNAQLKGAKFNSSYLNGADFNLAQLEGAEFYSTDLEYANFYLARLEGTRFNHSNIKGADFSYTLVRGTQFIDVIIDDKTNFTGTYLAEILIDSKLRKHLERNIRKLNITNTNVFVAMKFDSPDLASALENAIKPACFACDGLEACMVDEKAGDGWIPQRIKEEIQDARFVISDLTYRNPGVYYETGYADGLEIPVIQTCKRSWYDKEKKRRKNKGKDPLHFDIAQRNTIFWKDNEDFKQQLIMKINELRANGK